MTKIYTIGHSTLPLDIFLSRLKKHKINILVDVRTKPYSRWQPHFNRGVLADALERFDIAYIWKGANLGGLEENVDFDENIEWLVELYKTKQRVVVLCSEKDYKKCHRHLLIEPELLKYGVQMEHI